MLKKDRKVMISVEEAIRILFEKMQQDPELEPVYHRMVQIHGDVKDLYRAFPDPDFSAYRIALEDKMDRVLYENDMYAILELPPVDEWLLSDGLDMNHCLASVYSSYVDAMKRGETRQFSMFEKDTGQTVVNIEIAITKPTYSGPVKTPTITQLRGYQNQVPPNSDYVSLLVEFLFDFQDEYGLDFWNPANPNFDGKYDGAEFLMLASSTGIFDKSRPEIRSLASEAEKMVLGLKPVRSYELKFRR